MCYNVQKIFKMSSVPKWSAMVERFSASDLCSDGWVVRMWVRIPTATVVLVSLSKTLYHNCFSPPRSKWVPVRAELVVAGWAVYSPGSWDGFRNDLCTWWAGGNNAPWALEFGGYVHYISPNYYYYYYYYYYFFSTYLVLVFIHLIFLKVTVTDPKIPTSMALLP